MENDNVKKEGPSCACGKTDLYKEWEKNNQQVTTESKKEAKKPVNSKKKKH